MAAQAGRGGESLGLAAQRDNRRSWFIWQVTSRLGRHWPQYARDIMRGGHCMTIASWLKRGGWFEDTRQEQKTSCRRCCTSLFTSRLSSHTTVYFGAIECRSGQVRKYLLSAPCWARLADGLDSIPGRGSIKHRPTYCRRRKKIRHDHYCMGIPLGNR